MIELLWLLLPIAAASGWVAAKRSLQSKPTHRSIHFSADYFKGLNYLFNEQPDKAIDVFIKLLDVDSDTVETHLALGALFRRRGEVNRAIRIHENLIARPAISIQQRQEALVELAQDYRRAGLLDRAEVLFETLISSEEHRIYAYRELLDIYQQEHEWNKAIDIAWQLERISGESMKSVVAHYYCEQAELYRQQQNKTTAFEALQQALKVDAQCVRASLLQGYLALEQQMFDQAVMAFKQVEKQNPDFLSEIIDPLQYCYQQLGQTQAFKQYLYRILNHYGGITPMLVLAKMIREDNGEQPAADFLLKQLHQRSSVRGLDYLLDLALSKVESITYEHLLLLKGMTSQLLKDKPVYKCSQCGFMGKSLHWQCPSCKQWNTIKPIQGIDGE